MVIVCVSITRRGKETECGCWHSLVLVACVSVHKRQKETECGCQYCMSAFYEGINNNLKCAYTLCARMCMFIVQGLVVGRGNVHSEKK